MIIDVLVTTASHWLILFAILLPSIKSGAVHKPSLLIALLTYLIVSLLFTLDLKLFTQAHIHSTIDWPWLNYMAVCIFSGLLLWRLKNTPYFVSHQKSLKHLRTNTPQTTTYTFLKITGLLLAIKFVLAALFGGDDGVYDPEELLFLGTMHGLAYEPYFRGVLLLLLLHAVEKNQLRWKMPKVFIGLPYLATTILFALQISLSFSGGYWQFYPLSFLTMLIYGSMLCWLKVKTNNLLLVILAHNAAVLFSQFL